MKNTWLIILLPLLQNNPLADNNPLANVKIKKSNVKGGQLLTNNPLVNTNELSQGNQLAKGGELPKGNPLPKGGELLTNNPLVNANELSKGNLADGSQLQQDNQSDKESIKTIFDEFSIKKQVSVEPIKPSKKSIVHKKKSRWNKFTSFVKETFQTLRAYLKPIALGLLIAVIVNFNNGALSGTAIKNLLFFFS